MTGKCVDSTGDGWAVVVCDSRRTTGENSRFTPNRHSMIWRILYFVDKHVIRPYDFRSVSYATENLYELLEFLAPSDYGLHAHTLKTVYGYRTFCIIKCVCERIRSPLNCRQAVFSSKSTRLRISLQSLACWSTTTSLHTFDCFFLVLTQSKCMNGLLH